MLKKLSDKTKLYTKILTDAEDLLNKGWVRGAVAKDKYGVTVSSTEDCAERFCFYGAIQRSLHNNGIDIINLTGMPNPEYEDIANMCELVNPYKNTANLVGYNDTYAESVHEMTRVYKMAAAAFVEEDE